MVWKGSASEQRMRMVSDLLSGRYSATEVCASYGVSRPTGQKWLRRFLDEGAGSFEDRSSAPLHHPNRTDDEVIDLILQLRIQYPKWGARKLRKILLACEHEVVVPALSTVNEILRRHDLTSPQKKRRRCPPHSEPLAHAQAPGDVWCIDFKGDIRIGSEVLKPFTVTDAFSRYILCCEVLASTKTEPVAEAMDALFEKHGAPGAIRSDNGPPFATCGIAGLSRLSVPWIKRGIRVERIEPGKPQQNGRHERMHGTLKLETASPPADTVDEQVQRLEDFRHRFNHERPHEALEDLTPAEFYRKSKNAKNRARFDGYPAAFHIRKVDSSGKLWWRDRGIRASNPLRGEHLGLEPQPGGLLHVWFLDVKIGILDPLRAKIFNLPPTNKHRHQARVEP